MENSERAAGAWRWQKSVACVFAILLLQGILVHSLDWSTAGQVALFPDFRSLPVSLGAWTILDEDPVPKSMLDHLQPDDYLHRTYAEEGKARIADVFVAYFQSAESVNRPHSPLACLPGSGWIPISTEITQLTGADQRPVSLTRLVLRKESQTIFVLYWYQSDRRTWARESMARLQMIPEILRYQRSELAIVRIATLIDSGLDTTTADKMDRFAVSVHQALATVLKADRIPRGPLPRL